MSVIQLYKQFFSLPDDLQKKVEEYIDFLKYQSQKSTDQKGRIAGLAKGMIRMKDNFDDPLDDFQAYM